MLLLILWPCWVVAQIGRNLRERYEARRCRWEYRIPEGEQIEVLPASELDRLTVDPAIHRGPMFPPERAAYRPMYVHPWRQRGWWWQW